MNTSWKIRLLILILIMFTGCDLYTKHIAKNNLDNNKVVQIVPNYIELRLTKNENIAFSMLSSVDSFYKKIIIYSTTILAFIILSIVTWQSRKESMLWLISLMLIVSGAVGNLVDRIYHHIRYGEGYVIDFIHLHYKNTFSWPVFNVADMAITIGAIILAVLILRKSYLERNQVENN